MLDVHLTQVWWVLPVSILKDVYEAMFHISLDRSQIYSLLVGLPQYLIKRLQEVQNAAARSILRTPRSEHISPLLQNLHWLPVNRRTLHKVAALCHSSLSGSGPQYLSDHTHVYIPARSLHSSSDTRILSTSNVKLKSYGQRSFAYHGPSTWNSWPLALRYQQESDCFKRALKTHLFSLNEWIKH